MSRRIKLSMPHLSCLMSCWSIWHPLAAASTSSSVGLVYRRPSRPGQGDYSMPSCPHALMPSCPHALTLSYPHAMMARRSPDPSGRELVHDSTGLCGGGTVGLVQVSAVSRPEGMLRAHVTDVGVAQPQELGPVPLRQAREYSCHLRS